MLNASFPEYDPGQLTADELILRHRHFLSLSWKGCSPVQVEKRFMDCYGLLPLIIMQLKAQHFQLNGLYRARWIDPTKEDLGDPITYSYPRRPEKQIMGRANLPQVPVFYTCNDPRSSFAEASSSSTNGEKLIGSKWSFADRENWCTMVMVDHGTIMSHHPFAAEWEGALREYILKSGTYSQEHVILLHDLVADLFLHENYEITSWIADRCMQQYGLADLLIYPSLQTGHRSLCQAFKAETIDNGRVRLDQIQEVLIDGDDHRVVSIGVVHDDRIEMRAIGSERSAFECGSDST